MGVAGIYKILSPSGKIYIGQTRNLKRRVYAYSRKACLPKTKIYSSLVKYGFDSHEMKMIHELPKDVSQLVLDVYEDFYIKQFSECGFTILNMKDGGGGNNGLNEESRRKIGDSNKGREKSKFFTEQMKKRMIGKKYALGYRHTEETKKKIGQRSHRGNHPNAKKVKSQITGIVYDCIADAANAYNIIPTTLVNQLSGHRRNKTDLRYA